MVKSNTLSFTVPTELKLQLEAVNHTGYYDSLSEFLRDAIRYILKERKDLRTAMVYELYSNKHISLPKAAELLETNILEAKELLQTREL
jgi:Arc/MetJ-type ribon-helix-helix transcriptional regulator|tara:strand:+ start:29429 stop:29695 length:267 start_codon:yes stop_codon:yes gene_type:complete